MIANNLIYRIQRLVTPFVGLRPRELVLAHLPVTTMKKQLQWPGAQPVADPSLMIGHFLTTFGSAGNSVFVAAARAYLRSHDTNDVRNVLAAHYVSFQPTTLAEAFFGSNDPALAPLTELSPFDRFLPWVPRIRKISGYQGEGNQGFGPVSGEKLRAEANRIAMTTESLRRDGYRPEAFRDGLIRGYFLIAGGKYRIMVTEGLHRLGALSALGVTTVRIGLARRRHAWIDADEVDQWPHVRSGFCSREVALRIVGRCFAAHETSDFTRLSRP